jgi:Mg2+/Co2+ transporter CorC
MESEELLSNFGHEGSDGAKKEKKSPLISLEKDLSFYADSIKEVAVEIMVEGISSYPIFIAHQHQVSIGEIILNKDELNTEWTIQASTLEEFIQKGIVHPDKKEQFLKNYKKPESHMCIFVVVPEGANFVFYPYPKTTD